MIQHIWTVPCRVTITDQDTNNVSLIEVVEEINLAPAAVRFDPARPRLPLFFDVVTLWARERSDDPEVGFGRVLLFSPQGDLLIEQSTEIDLREKRRLRTFGRIIEFPTRGPGVYHFRVERRAGDGEEWQLAAMIPLDVTIEEAPAEADAVV
jgi:hypothetical protein